ncbi:MAG: hypothetical protein JWO08_4572 [Verrucomicrobiaceae bacterium]|nr:hypothetical protein [Verrucomicrobiaceae bacterium]
MLERLIDLVAQLIGDLDGKELASLARIEDDVQGRGQGDISLLAGE